MIKRFDAYNPNLLQHRQLMPEQQSNPLIRDLKNAKELVDYVMEATRLRTKYLSPASSNAISTKITLENDFLNGAVIVCVECEINGKQHATTTNIPLNRLENDINEYVDEVAGRTLGPLLEKFKQSVREEIALYWEGFCRHD